MLRFLPRGAWKMDLCLWNDHMGVLNFKSDAEGSTHLIIGGDFNADFDKPSYGWL